MAFDRTTYDTILKGDAEGAQAATALAALAEPMVLPERRAA